MTQVHGNFIITSIYGYFMIDDLITNKTVSVRGKKAIAASKQYKAAIDKTLWLCLKICNGF